jgi:hypothetical protein
MMVKTAVVWVPNVAPPVGLERVKLTVSLGSNWVSLTIKIVGLFVIGTKPVLLCAPKTVPSF